MSLVGIHCYSCDSKVSVEETAMSRGLQAAGWALEHGQTFCPSCARMRGLKVAQEPITIGDRHGPAAQKHPFERRLRQRG